MKTGLTLPPILSLLLLCAMPSIDSHAQDSFTRINTGPGAVPNGSSAAAWGDFNNDGWLDLFITSFGGTQYNYCYTNNRDGTFTRVLPTFFPANNINSFGCAWADYDNDGWLDLVKGIGNPFGGPTQLYRNNRNGTFSNVTAASIGNVGPGANNVVWGDYDNDGFVDLFMAVGYNAPDNILLHNRGDGTFSRVTGNPMVTATGISGGAAWGDYDNDGRLDLIVSRTAAACLLYHNEGGGTFQRITNDAFNTDTNAAGVSWGDYDNDGFLDLFIAHQQTPNWLYHNNGDGHFTLLTNDVIYQMIGPSSGGAWADYDNDGWLDLFVANFRGNSFLFRNDGHGGFLSVTGAVTEFGTGQGAAWGDYDNDGFPDLLVPNVFTYSNFLYHNNGNSNAWLTLKLEGRISNRAAIGAKVRIKATMGGRELWQLREISGGGSLGSQNDLRAAFGLGDATNAEIVRVEWPSGIVQQLTNIAARQFLTLAEPNAFITPAAAYVPAGTNVTLALHADLEPPLHVQWNRNGIAIAGATNEQLNISAVQRADLGSYNVSLTNTATGFSFTTAIATLGGAAAILQQPRSQNVRAGSNVTFSVNATGFPPIAFQWQCTGTNLPGATGSTLSVTNVQTANEGNYAVLVSNSYGQLSSSNAALVALVRPVVTIHPLSQSVVAGGSVTLSASAAGHPMPLTFRWVKNGAIVSSITVTGSDCFFTITNVQTPAPPNQLAYRVTVTNLAGSISSTTAYLTALADEDGDGLPDEWELAHGLNPDDWGDAALDNDADGTTNAAEYAAGTDPNDQEDSLRLVSIRTDSASVGFRFVAVSNHTYTAQACDALVPGGWRWLADVTAAATNRIVGIGDPRGTNGPQRYYRVLSPRLASDGMP